MAVVFSSHIAMASSLVVPLVERASKSLRRILLPGLKVVFWSFIYFQGGSFGFYDRECVVNRICRRNYHAVNK